MIEAINEGLRTHRERRQRIAEDRPQLLQILRARQRQGGGSSRQDEVHQVMAMDY